MNEKLPAEKRVRLLAGDPPIDWTKVEEPKDIEPHFSQRDTYPVRIIENEVLARKRKAFVIYGVLHLSRTNSILPGYVRNNITARLEQIIPGKVYVLLPISGSNSESIINELAIESNTYPTVIDLKDSELALLKDNDFSSYAAKSLADTADGVIYLGNEKEIYVHPDPSVEQDLDYQQERRRRREIINQARARKER